MTTVTAPRRTGLRTRGTPAVVDAPTEAHVDASLEFVDLEALSSDWQRALDAAGRALGAAAESLPDSEVRERRVALARETEVTAAALLDIARPGQPAPWLSRTPITNRMLGLPAGVRACIFDVEGVLTDSSRLHAWAWGAVFDDFLSHLGETTGWHLIPFDRVADYHAYVEGRSRLDGVRAFLHSRGIRAREGQPDDPRDEESVHGLARRKGELVERRMHEQGVTPLLGARRYLEAARRAGVMRAVVYESSSTQPLLERAGLASLIDVLVDAAVIGAEGLHSRPAPDLLVAACRRLDVPPECSATFTSSPAGVVAGRRAGMVTIGVAGAGPGEELTAFGAEQVVPSLVTLLDPRLRAGLDGEQ